MINISEEKNCCGCGACSIACPNDCITMTGGTLGHLFPNVDSSKCIDCGKCDSVCPMQTDIKQSATFLQKSYAAYAKDSQILFSGSSGGIFGVFAKKIIQTDGAVYGAAFNGELKLGCALARNAEELKPLYKSKYLQSDLTGRYEEIKKKLLNGENILFVSTPCQVAALKNYLVKDYSNLVTVDFFCHGVPSQEFFDRCIAEEEKLKNGLITSYEFRTKKKHGSTPHYFTEKISKNGAETSEIGYYFESPFYAFFQTYINLRESCYNCRFAGRNRRSDITIGDFHEIERYISGINRFKGVSTVVINTERGQKLWENCIDDVTSIPIDLEQLISDGVCFGTGTARPSKRDEFIADWIKMSTGELISKWVAPHKYRKQKIYYSLPSAARKALKRIMGV